MQERATGVFWVWEKDVTHLAHICQLVGITGWSFCVELEKGHWETIHVASLLKDELQFLKTLKKLKVWTHLANFQRQGQRCVLEMRVIHGCNSLNLLTRLYFPGQVTTLSIQGSSIYNSICLCVHCFQIYCYSLLYLHNTKILAPTCHCFVQDFSLYRLHLNNMYYWFWLCQSHG